MSSPSPSSSVPGPDIADLTDRAALFDLACAYARNVDRRDYEAVEALFVPGGRIMGYDGPDVSGEPRRILEADGTMAGRLRTGLDRYRVTTHLLGQQTSEVAGDEAVAETYCLAHHIAEGDGAFSNMVMSIRYQDRCRRVERVWRFVERRLAIDWVEERPLGLPLAWG